jgi:hypothetical protein
MSVYVRTLGLFARTSCQILGTGEKGGNSLAKKEFLELADICEEVANDMDDRRVSG